MVAETPTAWTIGSVRLERIPYFDVALDADDIALAGVAAGIDWAAPWLTDGRPTVGQAFWVIRSAERTIVVDPCGASDSFLRTGPDAVGHQQAAFERLRAAGCEPAEVDHVALTHLDGIGMVALSDGAPEGETAWTPAFENADIVISRAEVEHITARRDEIPGSAPFTALAEQGRVRAVDPPHELAPDVTLRATGAHSPGHCRIDIESGSDRAVLIGHLAISPLHAAAGATKDHVDGTAAWTQLRAVLDAADDTTVVAGSLWPTPGAARVVSVDPYELVPA